MQVTTRFRVIAVGLIFILVLIIASSASSQSTTIPNGDAGRTYYAGFPVVITLDGNFSDWSNVPRVTVTGGPQPAKNIAKDGTMIFAAVADANDLYVWVDVAKSNIIAGKHGENYYNEDSVEIYINMTGSLNAMSFGPGIAQITIPAASIGRPVDQPIISGQNAQGIGVRAAVVRTATGYAIEAAIPLHTSRWNVAPTSGRTMGFQIQENGATTLDRDIKLGWSALDTQDQSYRNPSVFGRLIFFGMAAPALQATVKPTSTLKPTATLRPTSTLKPTATFIPTSTPRPTSTPKPSATPPPAASGFSVRGAAIVGPNGQTFVAKGINVNGQNWVWRRSTVNDAHLIADCWGFNLVRVNSFLFTNEQPWPQYSDNNDLDAIVRAYTGRGVVVIFEAHDRIGRYYTGTDLTKLQNWFVNLAQRYRNNPYVWFDIINEPGGRNAIDVTSWTGMHQQVIRAIRETAGANNLIIVEGANGGQDAGSSGSGLVPKSASAILSHGNDVITFGGKTYGNILFSIHPYDQWNYSASKMTDFFDRVHADNHAIIVGEYGVNAGISTVLAAQATFGSAISRGVGRVVWHWDGHDYNDLTANTVWGGGWEINDCVKPTNLSWLGQQVWNDNH